MTTAALKKDYDLLRIAKAQKGVLFRILGNIFSFFIPLLFLVVLPFQLYFIYRLAQSLGYGAPILWSLGMLIPIVSLALLLTLSQSSTRELKNAGIFVGLMGADLDEVRRKMTEKNHDSGGENLT